MRHPQHALGIVLLVLITAIWGSTFVLVKDATEDMPTPVFLAWRFTLALIPFAFYLRAYSPKLWRDGMILGVWFCAGYATQAIGLQYISANRAAFITGLNVILVPVFLAILSKRAIGLGVWVAVLLCFSGIALISWEGGALSVGDFWTLLCAITYACYIIYLERTAQRHAVMPLTTVQIAFVALFCWLWAVGSQPVSTWGVPVQNWGILLYLAIIATAGTTLLQVIGQKYVSAPEAAIIYALEPVAASIFSYFWSGEILKTAGIIGGGLIVLAMVLSQLPERKNIAPIQD